MFNLILALIASWSALASDVAFLEYRLPDGRRVELEPQGRFMHVAILYKGRWLHAHPSEGVALTDDLFEYGHAVQVLHNPAVPEPSPAQVERWLGRPFDRYYSWSNPHATYCTRLVADLLGVEPDRMSFSAPHWSRQYGRRPGEEGLSPDDLYAKLKARGFRPRSACAMALAGLSLTPSGKSAAAH